MKIFLNKSRIIENQKITENYFLMKFEDKNPDPPGTAQFINIKINSKQDPFLRRPFAVFDHTKKQISILYKVVGKATNLMSKLNKGAEIEYFGFLGKTFNTDIKKKTVWVVAGGIGIGGVNLLLKNIKKCNKTELFLGFNQFREASDLSKFLKTDNVKSHIAVLEKNKRYFQGNVVELIKTQKIRPDMIFACGPEMMLAGLYHNFIHKYNIPAFFSLENIMACGIGTCMGCTIKIKEGNKIKQKRVCKDGPVFKAENIVF